MKKLSFILLLFTLTSLHAKTITNIFNDRNTEYKLELNYEKVNPKQDEGLLLTYKVYRENKLLETTKRKEPFTSCRDYDTPKIFPLKSTEKQLGWMIEANGICGNTHSYRYEVIFPNNDYQYGAKYYHQSFISKEYPLIAPNEYGVELFYYQQEWGNGGTATSYFVPHNIDYSPYDHVKLKEVDILKKIPFLEKNVQEEWLKPRFLGLFKAGLDSKNLPLMHHTIENYYDPNMMEWYKVHYSNPTKENLLKKIEQTKEKLNIKYMHNAYCYGIDTPPAYESLTMNLPIDFPSYYKPSTQKLELRAFPKQKSIFQKSYAGFKLLLANPTDKNITIPHEDSRFNIIAQAKDNSGKWKNIEHLPHSTCGNSYGTKQLSAHKVWVFSAPIYDGDTKVKLRYKMGDTVSNEFDGMINKEQFSVKWRDPNDPFDWLYGDLSFDSDR